MAITTYRYNWYKPIQKGISYKWNLRHSASSHTLSNAINSDFIVNRTIHVYLEDFHETDPPLRMKSYPLVDLDSSESAV